MSSLQQILGHSTLEMVRRYVSLASAPIAVQHRKFSPMDRIGLLANNGKVGRGLPPFGAQGFPNLDTGRAPGTVNEGAANEKKATEGIADASHPVCNRALGSQLQQRRRLERCFGGGFLQGHADDGGPDRQVRVPYQACFVLDYLGKQSVNDWRH